MDISKSLMSLNYLTNGLFREINNTILKRFLKIHVTNKIKKKFFLKLKLKN